MYCSDPGPLFEKAVVLAAAGCAVLLLGSASPALADEPTDWVLENCVAPNGSATTRIVSGVRCDLRNRKTGMCLVRKSNGDQADWDFAPCGSRGRDATIVAREGGPVACGQTVAVKLGHEYFRKCRDPQKVGINICSEEARVPQAMHYDWQFQGCSGQLEAGKAVALFNVSRRDSVVYAKRPSKVVDTCWSDTMKYGQCTTTRDK